MGVYPRRDAPETWYPAGVAGVATRTLTLPEGDHARIVEVQPQGETKARALLLHGWGCNAFHFRRLLPLLGERRIHAIALDLRGHGLSHKPSNVDAYGSARLAGFVQSVMDALDWDHTGLLGHSLGAAIALDVAIAAPARVSWLTLLNPVGVTPMRAAKLLRRLPIALAERMPRVASRLVGWTALHMAYGRLARPDAGDLEQYLFPTLVRGGRFGMLAYARAFSWDARAAEQLARIGCPIHVILGEHDRVVRAAVAAQHLRGVATARVDVIAGAGHVLAEEAPEIVADAVTRAVEATSRLRESPNDASHAPGATR